MTANKFPGVRAALCYDLSSARNSREHNNANVLTLGASLIGAGLAKQIVDTFLDTECTAERHLRRAAMIDDIDSQFSGVHFSSSSSPPKSSPALESSPTPASQLAPTTETALSELSEADLRRVADRISQLMGTPASGGQAAHACTEACGFCQSCSEMNPELCPQLHQSGADRIMHRGGGEAVPKDIAKYIDHTLLRPDATFDQVTKLCQEAREFGFASVCVNPCYVRHCAGLLRGSPVKVCTVIGFPLGANVTETKALEARRAIREGATEVDMVINVGALKSGRDELVYKDIRAVVEAAMDGGAICKVILETSLLNDDEKTRACLAARRARADFVKTATGFGPRRSDGRRRGPDEPRGLRNEDGRESIGRHSQPARCPANDSSGRHAHRRQCRRADRQRIARRDGFRSRRRQILNKTTKNTFSCDRQILTSTSEN